MFSATAHIFNCNCPGMRTLSAICLCQGPKQFSSVAAEGSVSPAREYLCTCAKVKQEPHWAGQDLQTFSPRTRSLIEKLQDSKESRRLVAHLLQEKHGAHGLSVVEHEHVLEIII